MIEHKYRIPKIGSGTDEDPWRPDLELTEPGEWFKVLADEGATFICQAASVSVLPFPIVD